MSRSITVISQLSGRTLNMHERSLGPPPGRGNVSARIEAQLAAAKAPCMADPPSTWLANRRNRVRDLEHSPARPRRPNVLFCASAMDRQLTGEAAQNGGYRFSCDHRAVTVCNESRRSGVVK